jgi:hypothetical protein
MSYHLYQAKQNTFRLELDNEFDGDLRKVLATPYAEASVPLM